jgi:hypothetical protein
MRHATTARPRSGNHRNRLTVFVAITSSVVIVACGSSSESPGAAGSSAVAQGIKATACIRSHGVSNLPDPSSGGGGIQIPAGSGINPQSPAFQSALRACAKLLPGGGPGSQHPSEQARTQALKIARCMRTHGVSGFPDPMTSPPSNPGAYSELESDRGLITGIPKTINTGSPAFKQAAAACSFTGG